MHGLGVLWLVFFFRCLVFEVTTLLTDCFSAEFCCDSKTGVDNAEKTGIILLSVSLSET